MRQFCANIIISLILGLASREEALAQPFRPDSADGDPLQSDDGYIEFVFRYPDVYGDDFRNMWFRMPSTGQITGVLFAIPTDNFQRWTTGAPDLVTMIWASGEDSLPLSDQVLLRDTLAFAQFSDYIFDLNFAWDDSVDNFIYADLRDYGLALDGFTGFNVGYTAVLHTAEDSLAILADDGSPETNYASEWYNGSFHRLREAWRGVNLFIRVFVASPEGTVVLRPGGVPASFELVNAYPNPFNSETRLTVSLSQAAPLTLEVFDVLGRRVLAESPRWFPAGRATIGLSGAAWSSGTYLVRLSTPVDSRITKLMLQR